MKFSIKKQLIGQIIRALALIVIALLAWFLTRQSVLADLKYNQNRTEAIIDGFGSQESIHQVFTSFDDGLIGVQLEPYFFRVPPNLAYYVRYTLRNWGTGEVIYSGNVSLEDLSKNPGFLFKFPSQPRSAGSVYDLILETNAGIGLLSFWASSTDAYANGSLYVKDIETDQDLAFRLWTKAGFGNNPLLFPEIGLVIGIIFLFLVIGSSLESLIGFLEVQRLDCSVIVWLSLGLTIPPVVSFILTSLHIRLTTAIVWITITILFGLGILSRLLRFRGTFLHAVVHKSQPYFSLFFQHEATGEKKGLLDLSPLLTSFLLFLMFTFALLTRIQQVQGLRTPLWVDGLFHVKMVEQIIDQGIILSNDLYHSGFHYLAGWICLLIRDENSFFVLLLGQLLSALSGFSTFILAYELTKRNLVGLVAAAATWFLSPFPGYLITWGRLPFLAAIVLLGPVIVLWKMLFEDFDFRKALIACLLSLGLFLTHYGVASFAVVFVILLVVNQKLFRKISSPLTQVNSPSISRALKKYGWIFLFFLCILLIRFPFANLTVNAHTIFEQSHENSQSIDLSSILKITFRFGGLWVWIVGLLGMFTTFYKNTQLFRLISAWIMGILLLNSLQVFFFDHAIGSFTNITILSYLPLSIFAGIFVDDFVPWCLVLPGDGRFQVCANSSRLLICTYLVLGSAVIVSGGMQMLGLVNPKTVQFSISDERSMSWIIRETKMDDLFFINSFRWGQKEFVPSDSGGWISEFTNRDVVFPEQDDLGNIRDTICNTGADYVYLGRQTGILDRKSLSFLDNTFELVYHQLGIDIYRVHCASNG